MRKDARLIALEVNQGFAAYLQAEIRDPRFYLAQVSAVQVDRVVQRLGLAEVDCVVSGIPFKTLRHPDRQIIVRKTHQVLRKGGVLLVYQISSAVEPYLQETFERVHLEVERGGLVPSRMFRCSRG
jgi:phospholipid N-methyltransferase